MGLLLGALCACQIAASAPPPENPSAAALVARARAARYQQDSLLEEYHATAKQRWTAQIGVASGLAVGPIGRMRLAARFETVARSGWHHQFGAWTELIAGRGVAPIVGEIEMDVVDDEMAIVIPYYPGRDRLWPVDELADVTEDLDGAPTFFEHPLSAGSDSLYRFQLGGTLELSLPSGRRLRLRELILQPRRPDSRLIVGSLWVDDASGALVRAAYRPSVPVDLWPFFKGEFNRDEEKMFRQFGPFRGDIEEILIEHGLFEERFWLPRVRLATAAGSAKGGRITISIEQTFEYERVRALPTGIAQAAQPDRESIRRWNDRFQRMRGSDRVDSGTCRDSRDPNEAALSVDSLIRRDDMHIRASQEGVRVRVLYPCNHRDLVNSPALPPSIYAPSEELFTEADFDRLHDDIGKALAISRQADWSPQPARWSYGLQPGLLRYNRVEGLAIGVRGDREFGSGLAGDATLRLGVADLEPNVELALSRASGVSAYRLGAYHRLDASDDWGNPLGLSASLAAFLLGNDYGFYHRSTGVELTGTHRRISGHVALGWRLFAERDNEAEVETSFSFGRAIIGHDFVPNIVPLAGDFYGAASTVSFGLGANPEGVQLSGALRLEGASGEAEYGRGMLDLRLGTGLGRGFGVAVSGAAGSSVGELPVQRHWFLGGPQTVHAQVPGSMQGDAFWMARAELSKGTPLLRPTLFADVGWAGDRDRFPRPDARLWSAGIGAAILDGLLRMDLSKALTGRRGWGVDVFIELR
ncbi:MAG: hypothetical protein KF709_11920 [Gemmatimonadaceae bacterium]|nr:hypothetical protein [Gemmatimonadaceae bacterium]